MSKFLPKFGKTKSSKEIISILRDNLLILNANPQRNEKERNRALTEVTRQLNSLKELVMANAMAGTPNTTTPVTGSLGSLVGASRSADGYSIGGSVAGALGEGVCLEGGTRANDVLVEIAAEMQSQDTLYLLLSNLDHIEFEASKYAGDLFCLLLHRQVGETRPMVDYLRRNTRILTLFLCGYEKPDYAIQYGTMLRKVARHEDLAHILLSSGDFYQLFLYVQGSAFDVSSDAFQSLRDLLTRHKSMVGRFLESNYETFFQHYHAMLCSENYVTRRQALKLLSELLLERLNFAIMKRYIDDVDNLKLIMNLLKAQEKQIAFEAFHCFKIFVANPNKDKQVHSVLFVNRDKLGEFLAQFLLERDTDDTQFRDEKEYLIRSIREMKPLAAAGAATPLSATPLLPISSPPPLTQAKPSADLKQHHPPPAPPPITNASLPAIKPL